MDLVFCDFCLSYNVKVFNISKEIEQKPIANVEHSGFLETVAELAAKVGEDQLQIACSECVQYLVQLYWFREQVRRARTVLKEAAAEDEDVVKERVDGFASVRASIQEESTLHEQALLSPSNVVEPEPVEFILYEIVDETAEKKESPPPKTPPPKTTTSKSSKATPRRTGRKRKQNPKATESPISSSLDTSADLKKSPKTVPNYTPEEIAKRPALCKECGLRFVRQDYLVVHMRRHTGERPYSCRFCDKTFPRTTDLNVHERYHTNQKSHYCTVCDKGFNRPYNLKVHMRVHTNTRPYKCPECPKSYRQSNDLKTHIRKHTGERSVCKVCGEAFLLAHRLTHHLKTVHQMQVDAKIGRLAKFNDAE